VVVHLVGRPTTRRPAGLSATLSNGGTTLPLSLDPRGRHLPLTFSVTPEGRSGPLMVSVVASADVDDASTGGSRGAGTIGFDAAGVVNLQVNLDPDDFQVNATTADAQFSTGIDATSGRQVAVLPDGSFFATWENNCAQTEGCDLLARRFAADTVPAANETSGDSGDFVVNLEDDIASTPAIDVGPGGQAVIAFATQDGFNHDVRAVRLDDHGQHLDSSEIVVSDDPLDEHSIDVAVLANGDFVVVWSRPISDTDFHYQVRARAFSADGQPRLNGISNDTLDFAVASSPVVSDDLPAITATAGGGFVVAWQRQIDGFTEQDVLVRRFDGDIAPLDDEAFVTSYVNDSADGPRLASLPGGGFALAWELLASDEPERQRQPLYAALFDASGVALAAEIELVSSTDLVFSTPAIAARADGTLGVAWRDCGAAGDGDGCGIRFQLLAADGTLEGPSQIVNTTLASEQNLPSIAALGDGFLVTWTDASAAAPDTSDQGIRARVIYP
jgi:hypothetical protein